MVRSRSLVTPITLKAGLADPDELPVASEAAARLERPMRTALVDAWDKAQLAVQLDIVEIGVDANDEDLIIRGLKPWVEAELLKTAALPHLRAAFMLGVDVGAAPFGLFSHVDVRPAKDSRLRLDLTTLNPESELWARRNAARLVEGNASLRRRIRTVIVAAQAQGRTPDQVARALREFIGLTQRQTEWVNNFRDRLIDEGVHSNAAIAARVGRYTEALRKQRSWTIARTELIQSTNAGQQAVWQQAISRGLIDPNAMHKKWMVTWDDRLDLAICEPMADVSVPIMDNFPIGVPYPPAHPNCRCTIALVRNVDAMFGSSGFRNRGDDWLAHPTSDPLVVELERKRDEIWAMTGNERTSMLEFNQKIWDTMRSSIRPRTGPVPHEDDDVTLFAFNDKTMPASVFGMFEAQKRKVSYSRFVSQAMMNMVVYGRKVTSDAQYAALETMLHEMLHSFSPKSLVVRASGDKISSEAFEALGGYHIKFFEEGLVEFKARRYARALWYGTQQRPQADFSGGLVESSYQPYVREWAWFDKTFGSEALDDVFLSPNRRDRFRHYVMPYMTRRLTKTGLPYLKTETMAEEWVDAYNPEFFMELGLLRRADGMTDAQLAKYIERLEKRFAADF